MQEFIIEKRHIVYRLRVIRIAGRAMLIYAPVFVMMLIVSGWGRISGALLILAYVLIFLNNLVTVKYQIVFLHIKDNWLRVKYFSYNREYEYEGPVSNKTITKGGSSPLIPTRHLELLIDKRKWLWLPQYPNCGWHQKEIDQVLSLVMKLPSSEWS